MSQSSFSVYADNTRDESSFLPYHDSMHASTMSTAGQPTGAVVAPPPHHTYVVPPSEDVLETTVPQLGFTQFDIKHPSSYEPVSTPAHHKPGITTHKLGIDLTFNMSTISAEDGPECCLEQALARPHTTKRDHLSTITEESSGKSKLTVSSSRSRNMTSSSTTSVGGGGGVEHDPVTAEVNPFEPGIVNRMFNSLGGLPAEQVGQAAPDSRLTITKGEGLLVGGGQGGEGVMYDSVSLLAEGSFSTLYLSRRGNSAHILQVCLSSPVQQSIINPL